MDPHEAQSQAIRMVSFMVPFLLITWGVGIAIIVVPFWQIFKKAGMAPGLSLLIAIPVVNLVMIYVLAFSKWKVVPAPYSDGLQPYPPPPTNYPPPPTQL